MFSLAGAQPACSTLDQRRFVAADSRKEWSRFAALANAVPRDSYSRHINCDNSLSKPPRT
jgi:hypothetical protein